MIAYTLQSPAPPFPVFVMAYTINGFGAALEVGGNLHKGVVLSPVFTGYTM